MSLIPTRVVVYTKDVSNMTGLCPKAARKLLCSIRKQLGKRKGSFITVQEFAVHTGIGEEMIKPFLK